MKLTRRRIRRKSKSTVKRRNVRRRTKNRRKSFRKRTMSRRKRKGGTTLKPILKSNGSNKEGKGKERKKDVKFADNFDNPDPIDSWVYRWFGYQKDLEELQEKKLKVPKTNYEWGVRNKQELGTQIEELKEYIKMKEQEFGEKALEKGETMQMNPLFQNIGYDDDGKLPPIKDYESNLGKG